VNALDDQFRTPIFLAAHHQISTVKLLIDREADPALKNIQKETILHVASANNHSQILLELLKDDRCKELINSPDYKGDTPLHNACRRKERISILSLLIKNGADPMIKNDCGDTPLHLAAQQGFIESARILMAGQKQNPLELVNHKNLLPFDLAIIYNRDKFIDFFLRRKTMQASMISSKEINQLECDSPLKQSTSLLLPDPLYVKKASAESYFKTLLTARNEGDAEKQILILLKISTLSFVNAKEKLERDTEFVKENRDAVIETAKEELEKALFEGAKIVNCALALLNKDSNLFERYLLKKLKVIEELYIKSLKKDDISHRRSSPLKALSPRNKRAESFPTFQVQKNYPEIIDKRVYLKGVRKAALESVKKTDEMSIEILKNEQEKLTEKFRHLLGILIKETEELFQEKFQIQLPKWSCIGIGPTGCGEMGPYSRGEFAFLIEKPAKPKHLQNFQNFFKILEIKIINLGESGLFIHDEKNEGEYQSPTIKGFCMTAPSKIFIGTPHDLALYQSKKLDAVYCIAGDKALVNTYNKERKKIMDPNKDDLACSLFKRYTNQFPVCLSNECINIKKEVYDPFRNILESFSLWLDLKKVNDFERIEELIDKRIFASNYLAENLKKAFEQIATLRWKAHLHYKEEKELVLYDAEKEAYYLGDEKVDLNEIYKVLQAFYDTAKLFYAHKKGLFTPETNTRG
jgi:hypothetical protein